MDGRRPVIHESVPELRPARPRESYSDVILRLVGVEAKRDAASDLNHFSTMLWRIAAESLHCRRLPVRGAAMIQDVFSALWFITLLIVVYGMATGDLCLWRRDD
jgi:hypothetical protein